MSDRVKKFIDEPGDVVVQALRGIERAHPDLLRVDHENQLIIRADAPVQGKVGIVSGGGSGHEPLHGGFVGMGMLDVAAAGAVFTSPVPDQILAATQAASGGAGVLHIVKNYTGDVLNFKMAADLASDEDIEVEAVVMDDDVAVTDSLYTAGRRGVGATILAEKCAGARAEAGGSLADVAGIARKVNDQARSFGVALAGCATPESGTPIFELGADEIEIGVGIHGEPGRRRESWKPAKDVAGIILDAILEDLKPASGSRILAFTNGLGGTPLLELYLLHDHVCSRLEADGHTVERSLVGPYITSLEMAGASVTLLVLDDELLELWDAPAKTVALRRGA